jgi:hypothetical protein
MERAVPELWVGEGPTSDNYRFRGSVLVPAGIPVPARI